VVQTFLIDFPVLAVFGVLFSFFTKKEAGEGSPFRSPYFWHGILFSTIFCGIVFYSYLKFPDWMWMYYVSGIKLSTLELIYLFLFLYYVPYIAGFVLGRSLIRKDLLFGWLLLGFLVVWEIWIVTHLWGRYSVVGTEADYLNGTAIPAFSSTNPLNLQTNIALGMMVFYFLFVWWRHKKRFNISSHESEF